MAGATRKARADTRPELSWVARNPQKDGSAEKSAKWDLTADGAYAWSSPLPLRNTEGFLCRLRWQTSAPKSAGRQRPTCAFMFAPSMYT